MKKVDITVCRAQDGTYSAYCNDHPALFGMGSTAADGNEWEPTGYKLETWTAEKGKWDLAGPRHTGGV